MKQSILHINGLQSENMQPQQTALASKAAISTLDVLSFVNNSLSTMSSLVSSTGSLSSYSNSHSTSLKLPIQKISNGMHPLIRKTKIGLNHVRFWDNLCCFLWRHFGCEFEFALTSFFLRKESQRK
jgi:hypothetical protein